MGISTMQAQVAINTDGSAPNGNAILHVKGSGNNHFFINDATGDVGIGTLTPATNFHLYDGAGSGTGSYYYTIAAIIENSNRAFLEFNSVDFAGITFNDDNQSVYAGVFYEYFAEHDYLMFKTGGADDQMVITDAGAVGIGTDSPSALLHVNGNVRFQGGLYDSYNDMGSSGQVLQTTGTGIDWVDASSLSDGDWTVSGSNMYAAVSGYIGIGTTSPSANFDLVGNMEHTQTTTSGNGLSASGSTSAALYYITNNASNAFAGLSAGSNSSTGASYGIYGFNYSDGYGVYGRTYHANGTAMYAYQNSNGNYSAMGNPNNALYAYHNSGNYAYLSSGDYGVFAENESAGVGDWAIYADGVDLGGVDGTNYYYYNSIGGVVGLNYYGNPYTWATAGYSYLDYNRSGGVFGGRYSNTPSLWGCLAYQNSSGTEYGGYFTSSTTGAGKDGQAMVNSGIGVYGDLFGADIHGNVYGAFIEGENYATYTKGNNYTSGLDVHLQKDGDKNSVMYTNVSTDATVMTSGTATLSKGNASIGFDSNFSNIVSEEDAIIVTVTPIGNSNGVYLENVDKNGFSVKENNNGRSDVTISYIAVGKRKGYENPVLAEEVVDAAYEIKLSAGLHNDSDTETDGQGLYYENGQLIVGVHSSTLPDVNKPEKVSNIAQQPIIKDLPEGDGFVKPEFEEVIVEGNLSNSEIEEKVAPSMITPRKVDEETTTGKDL